ncbi:nitric oxide reductase activation protein NorD [Rhodoferax sp. BAB1]|uniref:nitric oxide reductase activation protein NorD n=1 Tax=Rhodoferax sp. BAB1 TaxID=2741720 RepID=UPI00157639DF|nr:VWA domain-containing protein [Rhodoferax sp. BAB1]QKO22765.1 VWA domain-containing protein [Rhodoferax sp. BAB1]
MPVSPEAPRPALALLLQALSGRELQLQTLPAAPPDTPPARAILTPTHLLLPAGDWAQQRAAVAHAAAHLLHSPVAQASSTLKPLAQAVVAAVEDARVEQLLMAQLPGIRPWFLAGLRESLQPQGLSFTALVSRLSLALHDEDYADGNAWVDKGRSLFAAARAQHGLQDCTAFRRLAAVLANDLGQMRVRFEPQQYAVPATYRDDNSYLWDHGVARDEEAQALQAPLQEQPPAGGAAAQTVESFIAVHHYPEWDARSAVLRQDWCTLYELRPLLQAGAAAAPAHQLLPLVHRHRPLHGRRLRRQWEGETLDLDAAIEAAVERRLAGAPSGRLFQRPGPQARPLSLLVLLDVSQSTGERAGAAAPSLLEVEQQAALLLARTAQVAGERIALHAFCSDTRARVRYHRLLDFGAPLDAQAEARLLALRPAWSTRLGAALRHASTLLAAEPAERRALLVLTDGAPSDVDVHDARYLVEDARAAVLEAARLGLPVCGLAVDAGAAAYARRIFGAGNYRIAETPARLPRQLSALHARLTGI